MADRFYRDIEIPNFPSERTIAAPDSNDFIQLYGVEGSLVVKRNDSTEIVLASSFDTAQPVNITNTDNSVSTITGALTVAGGVGVGGNVSVGGGIYAGSPLSLGSSGQVLTSTGTGIEWATPASAFNGGTITDPLIINNTTQSDETITAGALLVAGGVGIEKDLHIKGDLHIVGTGTLRFGPYNVGATDGNLWWVRKGGTDLDPATVNGAGEQLWTAFATIKYALSQAAFGDTIIVEPGEYEEIFPLVVPAGVTLRGAGLRETQVKPTPATNDLDAILVSGDSTVSDMTVKGFFYNSTNDTGYAFRYNTGAALVERSTYIQRVTVLTKGSVTSSTDPYGFNQGDAGRGALVDGALVSRESLQAALLFNEATFIVPNSRALIMTNGARVEWLTCFTYFADLAIEGKVGATGRGGDGKTYITLSGKTGTWAATNTVSLYDTDGTTVIASATIESVVGDKLIIDGSVSGFVLNSNRDPKLITVSGNAQLDTAIKQFGTASLLLDGTGDYITAPSSADFDFGTGDWAIEFWVYRATSPGANQILVDMRTSATEVVPYIYLNSTYNVVLNVNGTDVVTTTSTVALTTWTHIAVTHQGTSTRVFVGGTQSGGTFTDNNTYIQGRFRIGADYQGNNAFNGQIDELRVSKGFARYTANFTAPTAEFKGDADTVLLLHFNGTDTSTAIVDDGTNFQDVRSSAGGTATAIIRYDRAEFAAELRSIASANIYGNQGVKADGADVLLQLMAHNFAYIGTGANLTNDKSSVNQANEVIELNGGRVFYNSVDQNGDFRIGESFLVDFETGAVSFSGGTFDVTAIGSINFVDGADQTTVTAAGITTGNLSFAGNSITTTSGNLTLDPTGAGTIALNGGTTVTGTFNASGNTTLTAGTASTTTTTGTLVVTGGVGVSGTVYAGGFNGPLTGNVTGTASLATDVAGGAANQLLYQTATNDTAFTVAPTVASTYLRWNGTAFDWTAVTASAAGSTGQIQFNNLGSLAASANFTYDSATNRMSLLGTDAEILLQGITTEPTLPAAGQMYFYAKDIGGRMLPKVVGPSGFDTALQPLIATNKVAWWNPPGNATTVPGVVGFNAPVAAGTATARNVATTNILTRSKRLGYDSQNGAGSIAGNYSGQAQFTLGTGTVGVGGFYYVCRFGSGVNRAGDLMFTGMTSSVAAPGGNVSPATLTNCIGVGAAVGDTNMSIYYGGSAAQTPIALGANFPKNSTNTIYELILFAPSNANNEVDYRVTNLGTGASVSGTLTAATPGLQLPLNTTLLAHRSYRANGATAGITQHDIISIYIETDT